MELYNECEECGKFLGETTRLSVVFCSERCLRKWRQRELNLDEIEQDFSEIREIEDMSIDQFNDLIGEIRGDELLRKQATSTLNLEKEYQALNRKFNRNVVKYDV